MTRRLKMFATTLAACALVSARVTMSAEARATDEGAKPAANSGASPLNPAKQVRLRAEYGKLPLAFEANQGQTDGQVRFLSRGAAYTLFLTSGAAVLDLKKSEARSHKSEVRSMKYEDSGRLSVASRQLSAFSGQPSALSDQSSVVSRQSKRGLRIDSRSNDQRSTHNDPRANDNGQLTTDHGPRTTNSALAIQLAGANPNATISGEDELPGKSNYFIGNDPKKWRTNVANYGKVRYKDVYPGIDLVYYGNQGGRLEYDFVVAPGADPGAIKLDVGAALVAARQSGHPQGAPLHVAPNGDLVVKINGSKVRFNKPVIYQPDGGRAAGSPLATRHSSLVEGRYHLRHHQVTFDLAKYDRTRPLVIDPALSYSTYLDGSLLDVAYAIAVDASGDAYVTGGTCSADFPVTMGAFQTMYAASECFVADGDAFISKLNPAGTALIYSTYLGGSSLDYGLAIALDSSGHAYVTGLTGSSDFPTTQGALQTTIGNGASGFVTELNPTGSGLVYSTFIPNGGAGQGIAVDAEGNAYVSGYFANISFTTQGAFQGCTTQQQSAPWIFAMELNPAGSAAIYSACLLGAGGAGILTASIAVDSSGAAYVTGDTSLPDVVTTPGAFQPNPPNPTGHSSYSYVTKLNPAGSAPVYSTYLDGTSSEQANAIALDTSGDAFIVGLTTSADFPTTLGAFDTTCHACASRRWDGFVTELNAEGSGLVYSTFLGGSSTPGQNGDSVSSVAVDAAGDAWVAGQTTSSDFPLTSGALNTTLQQGGTGLADLFLTEFNPTGSALVYSTFITGGGTGNTGVALDALGDAYVAGSIIGGNLITTPGAFQLTCFEWCDGVLKLVPGDQALPLALSFGNQDTGTTSTSQTTVLTNSEATALSISGVSISGADAADFTQTNNCGASLAAGASCTATVTFSPGAAGSHTATLSFTDSAANSPQTVGLNGTGIAAATVETSPVNLTFGNELVGTTSSAQPVTVTNSGTAAMTITSVAASAGFAETNTCGSTVAVGASCAISVSFAPAATGAQAGTVTITDNAPTSPQTIAISGTGVAPLVALSPSGLTFPSQTVGTTSAPQNITLTNSGTAALAITSIGALGDFSVSNNCGTSLAVGSSCSIAVVFSPQETGTRSGSLTLTDSAAGGPQTVALTGTGVGAPGVRLSSSSLTFAALSIGATSAAQTITVTNSGSASLTVAGVVVTGDYAETNTCGSPVAAGANCAIAVVFTPATAGGRPGVLTINDNAPGNPQVVGLSGTGLTGAVASLSPGKLSFTSQLLGTSSLPETVTLTNTGGTPLTVTGVTSSSAEYGVLNACGSTVAAGASCSIGVFFDPTSSGSQPGTLTIADNAQGGHQTVALSGAGMDFTLSATNSAASTSPGGTAGYSLYVVPVAGFDQPVSLACAGAPAQSTCTVTPGSIAPGGSGPAPVQVSVTTTSSSGALTGGSRIILGPMKGVRLGDSLPSGVLSSRWLARELRASAYVWLWVLALILGTFGAAWRLRALRKSGIVRLAPALVLLMLALSLIMAGCGGSTSPIAPTPSAVTPPGAYNLTVTGTFKSGTTVLVHSVALKLTIQ